MKKQSHDRKKNLLLSLIAISSVIIVILLINPILTHKNREIIKDFTECLEAGYVVMESYPRQCRTGDGNVFIENLSIEETCQNLFSGNWLGEQKECEFISEEQCSLLEGEFNECASACRHSPNSDVCIMLCVPVCKL